MYYRIKYNDFCVIVDCVAELLEFYNVLMDYNKALGINVELNIEQGDDENWQDFDMDGDNWEYYLACKEYISCGETELEKDILYYFCHPWFHSDNMKQFLLDDFELSAILDALESLRVRRLILGDDILQNFKEELYAD